MKCKRSTKSAKCFGKRGKGRVGMNGRKGVRRVGGGEGERAVWWELVCSYMRGKGDSPKDQRRQRFLFPSNRTLTKIPFSAMAMCQTGSLVKSQTISAVMLLVWSYFPPPPPPPQPKGKRGRGGVGPSLLLCLVHKGRATSRRRGRKEGVVKGFLLLLLGGKGTHTHVYTTYIRGFFDEVRRNPIRADGNLLVRQKIPVSDVTRFARNAIPIKTLFPMFKLLFLGLLPLAAPSTSWRAAPRGSSWSTRPPISTQTGPSCSGKRNVAFSWYILQFPSSLILVCLQAPK